MVPTARFTIRPVRPAEYDAVGQVIAAAYLALPNLPGDSDWYFDEIRDVRKRADLSCVLAAVADDGSVLGGVTYVSGPDDPYSEELGACDAGIRMLGVAPEAQRRGVGRALVEACIERAIAAGRNRVVLHTGVWMPAAQRLYARLGFRREPALDFEPAPGVVIIAYVLDLAATERTA